MIGGAEWNVITISEKNIFGKNWKNLSVIEKKNGRDRFQMNLNGK